VWWCSSAAGNAGFQKKPKGTISPCLADPGYNPYVIAVAGADTMGTAPTGDDQIGTYSSGAGGGCKNPDFAAPGSHLQGLRVANSYIDANHPEGLIDSRYFRGSGTSEATAITSGAVALILQKYPSITPDQVKNYLASFAAPIKGAVVPQQGQGEIRLAQMLPKPPPNFTQKFPKATGTGTLEIARGTDHITANGVVLTGETDIFGKPLSAATLATAEATGSSWSGGSWNGSSWSGSSWSGSSWSGSTWSGNSWSGSSWSGSTWSGSSWSGSSWSSSTWSGSSWSGESWSGGTWAGGSWQGATWD
jgi:serine protease AprX